MRSRVLALAIAAALITGFAFNIAAARSASPYGIGCAGVILKPDGTPWRCTFDDEFDGPRLDTSRWVAQSNTPSGDLSSYYACFEDTPSTVSVSGGALHLSLVRMPTPIGCGSEPRPAWFAAGQVSTYHLFSQAYGRFEARVRTTASYSPGLHEAFWLWPDDRFTHLNWPTTGEIDVAETYSNSPHLAVPYLHYTANDNGGPIDGVTTAFCWAERAAWNTYDLTWTPTSITVAINGRTCLENTSHDPAFTARYILMLSGTIGLGPDAPTVTTQIPATTDVDYVRVWN